jgi:ArsR family transcriptional regulator, arsenate/arsenite/antimonite-responsive transcriptional repressor
MLDVYLTIIASGALFSKKSRKIRNIHIIFFSRYYMMDDAGDYTIDKTTIDSLSSDTRIFILSCLRERKKTNAELAKELSLTPPTIHHHLELLKKADLVVSVENDHKWIYYDLTPFGRALFLPEKQIRVSIILSSVLTFGMALAVFLTYLAMPSLDTRPWIPIIGDPFFRMFIVAVLAMAGQAVILVYTLYPGRWLAE